MGDEDVQLCLSGAICRWRICHQQASPLNLYLEAKIHLDSFLYSSIWSDCLAVASPPLCRPTLPLHITLHFTELHCTSLHFTELHWTSLNCLLRTDTSLHWRESWWVWFKTTSQSTLHWTAQHSEWARQFPSTSGPARSLCQLKSIEELEGNVSQICGPFRHLKIKYIK